MLVRTAAVYVRVRQCTYVSVTYCAVRWQKRMIGWMPSIKKSNVQYAHTLLYFKLAAMTYIFSFPVIFNSVQFNSIQALYSSQLLYKTY